MNDYIDYLKNLFQRYRRRGILLDSNILLLYFVGWLDEQQIPRFRRTETFAIEDYSLLVDIVTYFEKVVTTPNILTEVSNLLGGLAEPSRGNCFEIFALGISEFDEHWLPSADISKMGGFRRFGLTDTGIMDLARGSYLVLTVDLPLSQYLASKGIDVLNFNEIRMYRWEV